jgi:hypothetical protein
MYPPDRNRVKMKCLGWFVLYVAMWMGASLLMTRLYNWPKESEMTLGRRASPPFTVGERRLRTSTSPKLKALA